VHQTLVALSWVAALLTSSQVRLTLVIYQTPVS
jgi:hypothetical protein